jgi:hypothetical protein
MEYPLFTIVSHNSLLEAQKSEGSHQEQVAN